MDRSTVLFWSLFRELSGRCRSKGHLALGLGRDGGVRLNIPDQEPVSCGDQVVTIGAARLDSF